MWLLLAAAAAWAQEVGPQQMLHDAVALEGLYGDLEGAVQRYRLLVRNGAMDDASRARAVTMLGRALYDLGRVDEARQALFEGRASGVCSASCVTLLQALVIEQEAVQTIPAVWDFDETDHSFFHPFPLQEAGAIRVGRFYDGTGVLEWETTQPARGRDMLVVGLMRPTPAPTEVTLSVTSGTGGPGLIVAVEDELGRRWVSSEPIALPRGTRVDVTLPLNKLRPDFEGVRVPVDASRLTRVALETVAPKGLRSLVFLHTFSIR